VGTTFSPGYSKWDFTTSIPINSAVTLTAGVFDIFNGPLINVGRVNAPGTIFKVGLEATF